MKQLISEELSEKMLKMQVKIILEIINLQNHEWKEVKK
jgi:hypothetical protein